MDLFSSIVDSFVQSKLKIRIFFAASFIIFALIISGFSFIINYNYENNKLKNSLQKEAFVYIDNKTKQLNHELQMQKNNVLSLGHSSIVQQYIQDKKDPSNVVALFEQVISAHTNIMQLRYIDASGMENIRLERGNFSEKYRIIAQKDLQNKYNRYYFQETKNIQNPNELWISDIDLNIENNKVVKPFTPTIRIAMPLKNNGKFQGIIIINLFMEQTLDKLTNSSKFFVSLLNADQQVIMGKYDKYGEVIDYSWSQYLTQKFDISTIFPDMFEKIFESYQFSSETIFSKKISDDLKLQQELFLVLKIKQETIDNIKQNTLHKIYDTLGIVLLISGPIGLLFALIPSSLAAKVNRADRKLNEKTLILNEYLEAMNVNNIISKSDLKGNIIYVNNNFCEVSGYTQEEVLGQPHSLLRDPAEPQETFKILWLTIKSKQIWKGILRNKKKDGTFYDVDIAIMPILNAKNEIIEYLAIRHEITELVAQRKNLLSIATKDPLTEVGNRYKLINDIQEHIVNNICVIDIDKFSMINDFYGHDIGDDVIKKFADLLVHHLTDEFSLYRLHGDKFAILNYSLDNERFSNFINHLNQKMIESVIETNVKEFDIVTTSGISSQSNEIILSTAEIANKHAKKINKKVLSYSSDLEIESQFEENIKWTEKIKKALQEERFEVFYQPIYDNNLKSIHKYESLIRMIDTDGKIISPFFFLDIAKSSGQYIEITKRVIQQSFAKFENLDYNFSINLTIEDILDSELCIYLEEMIIKHNIAQKLVIELVESEGIEKFEHIQNYIKKLKSFGCKIAIDDFGTGYSNFEYLIKLDADFIKIDGSMIKNINTDENSKNIVATILEFAKKMGYKTIAEYVASQDIHDTVIDMGIDFAQGYHIAAPSQELFES